VLIGLHPNLTQIVLPDGTLAYQGVGAPKAVIRSAEGGAAIVSGLGISTGGINPRATGLLWMAGAASLVEDVKFQGGHGTDALDAASKRLMQMANSSGKVVALRSNNKEVEPQMRIVIDQEKIGAMGVDITAVNSMLSVIFTGRDVNDFTLNGEIKPVYVQGDAPFRMQPDDLNHWYARNTSGEMVPFSAFTRTEWVKGAPTLARFNATSAIPLDGGSAPGVSSGDAMDEMEALTSQLGGGYTVAWQGISYQERLSGSQAPMLYAISVLVVFLCLAALYESWSIPFSVIMAVPVGVLGTGEGRQLQGSEQACQPGQQHGRQVTGPPGPQCGGEGAGQCPADRRAEQQAGHHPGELHRRRARPAEPGRRVDRAQCRGEGRQCGHPGQRCQEQSPDEQVPGHRQQGEAGGVQRLVHPEEHQGQEQPAEHDQPAGQR
jgi:hypothetical protein